MEEELQHKMIGLLTTARGFLELALMRNLEQEIRDCLKMSLGAIDKMVELIKTKKGELL
jgi:hypothetical protein